VGLTGNNPFKESENITMFSAKTDGTGLYSRTIANVEGKLEIEVSEHDPKGFGELFFIFDSKEWVLKKHGMIYTDKGFLKTFRSELVSRGFSTEEAQNVEYSEHGMQGSNFVSFDIGEKFIEGWRRVFGDAAMTE
jgi:hypothetical protein